MATRRMPSEEEVVTYMTSLNNWGRWGPDDELGTLNLITPEKTLQAVGLVKEGISVTCARLILHENASDVPVQFQHYMVFTGEAAPDIGPGFSGDYISMPVHGHTITHIDSPVHNFWDGKMYNGKPASLVNTMDKASAGGIQNIGNGVITRGVMLDIAKVQGKKWLDEAEAVFPEDLEEAEAAQGVRVEEGDALLVRMGWYKKRQEVGPPTPPGCPGVHAACYPWLHERGVSLMVTDTNFDVPRYTDSNPSEYSPEMDLLIPSIGTVAMGLFDIDVANLEDLAEVCNRLNRWEFMFIVAPLRIHNGTGSPVNPLALF